MKCRNSNHAVKLGSATVPVAPVGVSPTGPARAYSPDGVSHVVSVSRRGFFGGTPKNAGGTPRAPRRIGQRGVALVITLIMLAVITVITVVFLATTRRNRSSTTVRIAQTDSEFAAATAYNHAVAQIVTNIFGLRVRDNVTGQTNSAPDLLAFDFFVSRPLSYGYELSVPQGKVVRPLDDDTIPRVLSTSNALDVYLDLNRNRRFDDPENPTNRPYGDPIWLGVLDRPWFPHSRTNQFKMRFAYMVIPAGKALDLNTIHHDTSLPNPGYGFMRNQGFGPWELNLAAFLHELDPGIWDYSYTSVGGKPVSAGNAFEDATGFVRYREGWPANAQSVFGAQNFAQVFPNAPANNFPPGTIDVYADGNNGYPIGANLAQLDDDYSLKPSRWPGAENTNHFYNVQELFNHAVGSDSNKVTYEFYLHLTNAMSRPNAIGQTNGAAYYKLISQFATDTGSDVNRKINLNFADASVGLAVTNFTSWDSTPELAEAFFTNVAQRIFLAQSNEFNPTNTAGAPTNLPMRSITAIPVAPTNQYWGVIHRILQETANIFDATRNNGYPSVFRPLFGAGEIPGVTYIVGWTNDNFTGPNYDNWLRDNTNGIPAVVGAKKGLPNFNEFTLRTVFLITRKLQVVRDKPLGVAVWPSATNQMYILGISNSFQTESWNSYERAYPRAVSVSVSNFASMSLSNSLGFQTNSLFRVASVSNYAANAWLGRGQSGEFILPMASTNVIFLSNAVYRFGSNVFVNVSTNAFESFPGFPIPDWIFTISNRLTYLMTEGTRILDFALLSDDASVDLNADLVAALDPYAGIGGLSAAVANVWNTSRAAIGAPTEGIIEQMDISLGNHEISKAEWSDFSMNGANDNSRAKAIDRFRVFNGLSAFSNWPISTNWDVPMQAPFNPAAKLSVVSTWQANDPLVHYHVDDLRIPTASTNHQYFKPRQSATNTAPGTLGYINDRYSPWGGNLQKTEMSYNGNVFNMWTRDPGAYSSDEWQFPSNKLATIGELGRVHRGTPWQTIYFKSSVTNPATWLIERPTFLSHPSNDWKLPDLFTTALDARTSSGLMSINQTNMESWSATLSAVLVLSNSLDTPTIRLPRSYDELFIQPWGNLPLTNSGFAQIWNGIFAYQTETNRGRPLQSVGEFLQSVPELTTKSPFLNLADDLQLHFGIDDYAYEQIPRQILSLLRVGQPRFIIYAYGQALRPQRIDPATGLVVNYEVTAEFATRTVLRLEGDARSRLRAVVESFNILPPD